MLSVDDVGAVEIGDSPGDFDNLEIGASGEVEFLRGGVKDGFSGRGKLEESGNLVGGEGRVEEGGAAVTGALAV